ncbi:hypothetical protein D3C73_1674230 [compost metagenome]
MRSVAQCFADLPHSVGDVADYFDLWEVHRIDFRRAEVDVDDLGTATNHEERRFFDHVMADVDD